MYVDYSLTVLGFGAGVAFCFLLKKLIVLRNKRQTAGQEHCCGDCEFKTFFNKVCADEET